MILHQGKRTVVIWAKTRRIWFHRFNDPIVLWALVIGPLQIIRWSGRFEARLVDTEVPKCVPPAESK